MLIDILRTTGTIGMLEAVKKKVGAIGYVSYAYAKRHHMQLAAIKNGDQYVLPSTESIKNAVRIVSINYQTKTHAFITTGFFGFSKHANICYSELAEHFD